MDFHLERADTKLKDQRKLREHKRKADIAKQRLVKEKSRKQAKEVEQRLTAARSFSCMHLPRRITPVSSDKYAEALPQQETLLELQKRALLDNADTPTSHPVVPTNTIYSNQPPRRATSALLSEISDEIALNILQHFTSAKDLCSLALTCKRFSMKYVTAVTPVGCTASPEEAGVWSIVDEMARRKLAQCHERERAWVPRITRRGVERWLGLMFEVEALRLAGTCFCRRSHEQLRLTDGGAKVTRANQQAEALPAATTAANMRAGRHFAQITVGSCKPLYFGVVPSSWNVEQGTDAFNEEGHCFYFTHTGHRSSTESRRQPWAGMQRARYGDRIGLLLDSDQGTLTVFRNGTKLGQIAEGLNDEYRWAVVLHNNASARIDAVSVEHALEEAQYRGILEQMRPYKTFVHRYANGALRNWQEASEQRLRQVDTPLDPEERARYTKHVRIANAIRTMFARLLVLLAENPQEHKSDCRLVEVRKIKATLDKVVERCTNGIVG